MSIMTRQEYVEALGKNCPYCGSDMLKLGEYTDASNSRGSLLFLEVTCCGCEEKWWEKYELSTIVPVDTPIRGAANDSSATKVDRKNGKGKDTLKSDGGSEEFPCAPI